MFYLILAPAGALVVPHISTLHFKYLPKTFCDQVKVENISFCKSESALEYGAIYIYTNTFMQDRQILLVYNQGMYTFQLLPEILHKKARSLSLTLALWFRDSFNALVSPALNRKY